MKEYKVVKAKNTEEAEKVMNEMAQEGWRVVNVAYWANWSVSLVVTFERDQL